MRRRKGVTLRFVNPDGTDTLIVIKPGETAMVNVPFRVSHDRFTVSGSTTVPVTLASEA